MIGELRVGKVLRVTQLSPYYVSPQMGLYLKPYYLQPGGRIVLGVGETTGDHVLGEGGILCQHLHVCSKYLFTVSASSQYYIYWDEWVVSRSRLPGPSMGSYLVGAAYNAPKVPIKPYIRCLIVRVPLYTV